MTDKVDMKLEMEIIEIDVSPEYYDPENFTWTEKGRLYSAESMVSDYFVGLGYKVIRGTYRCDELMFRRLGAPDLWVEKDGHGFFVEVKSFGDSLSMKQVGWNIKYRNQLSQLPKLAVVPQDVFKVLEMWNRQDEEE